MQPKGEFGKKAYPKSAWPSLQKSDNVGGCSIRKSVPCRVPHRVRARIDALPCRGKSRFLVLRCCRKLTFKLDQKIPGPLRLTPDLHLADCAVFCGGPADSVWTRGLGSSIVSFQYVAPQFVFPGIQPEPGSFGPNVRFSKGFFHRGYEKTSCL